MKITITLLAACTIAVAVWRMTSPMSTFEFRLYWLGIAFAAILYAAITTITRRFKK